MKRLELRAGVAGLAAAGGVGAGMCAGLLGGRPSTQPVPAARGVWAAAGILAVSVLADSAIEHYRGQFRNPGMYAPMAASAAVLGLAASQVRGPARPINAALVCGAAAAVGAAGLAFHAYNVGKRPGRLSWHNLFYAAPIGAPAALTLAGVLGLAAQGLGRLR